MPVPWVPPPELYDLEALMKDEFFLTALTPLARGKITIWQISLVLCIVRTSPWWIKMRFAFYAWSQGTMVNSGVNSFMSTSTKALSMRPSHTFGILHTRPAKSSFRMGFCRSPNRYL
jgi:hypothetical protein